MGLWTPKGARQQMRLLSSITTGPSGSDHFTGAGCPAVAQAPSLEIFKTKLDKVLTKLLWSCGWPCFEQEIGLETSRGPFQPKLSYDPMVILLSKAIALVFSRPPEIHSFSRCSWRQEWAALSQLRPAWNTLGWIVSGSDNVRITNLCNSSLIFAVSSWFPQLCHSRQLPEQPGFL